MKRKKKKNLAAWVFVVIGLVAGFDLLIFDFTVGETLVNRITDLVIIGFSIVGFFMTIE